MTSLELIHTITRSAREAGGAISPQMLLDVRRAALMDALVIVETHSPTTARAHLLRERLSEQLLQLAEKKQ